VRTLDKTEAKPLAGTDGAQYPFWSPDGRSLGFFAAGKLYRIDSAGGPPQALANAPQNRGGTWSRDGVILFTPTNPSPLMRVSASGGEPVPITKLDSPKSPSNRFPQFLPDGRHFLFYASAPASAIYLGSIDGGDPKQLVLNDTAGSYLAPGRLAYVRQGTLVAQRLDVERGVLVDEPETLADSVDVERTLYFPGFSVSASGRSPTVLEVGLSVELVRSNREDARRSR
jgi:eukaryotic-like serine/threonine-protein kinase